MRALILLVLILAAPATVSLSCQRRVTGVSGTNDTGEMKEIEITHITRGPFCGVEQQQNIAVTDNAHWKELWTTVQRNRHPADDLPEIDFSRQTIICVFLGTRSTGGYSVEILGASLQGDTLTVLYTTESPAPGDMVSMAITHPCHIVSVDVTAEQVEFSRKD
ncbi:MAG: protease complex subunit PrcB family protein [Marinilabiliales bacterium]|nr:MAG: protease complex subunit PrcB family protein [Marinilabiliales bacterium]